MKRVTAKIERAKDGTFWCAAEIGKGLFSGTGNNAEEAKQDMLSAYEESEELGEVAKGVTFSYKYDIASFFDYFRWINATEVAKRANMSPSQLHQYIGGFKSASEKTYTKLSQCVENIKIELIQATF